MNNILQGLAQTRKTRKFAGVSENTQIRAEITENANEDYINVRPNPTCYQCRKLVEEVKRLKRIIREGHSLTHLKNPGWENEYVEDPEQISPRVNAAFVYKKSRTRTEEIEQLRKEVTRLQRELRLRSEEVYALRGRGQLEVRSTSQSKGTSKSHLRDHHTLGESENNMRSMYTQLYQKEWSQAYAYQMQEGVEKTVAHGNLLNILQLSFSQCRDIADRQLSQILLASSVVTSDTPPHTTTKTPQQTTTKTSPQTSTNRQQQSKQHLVIQDSSRHSDPLYTDAALFQRQICDQLLSDVQKKILPGIMEILNLKPYLKSSAVIKSYANSCIEVAWKIMVQKDQVYLDNSVVRFSDFDAVKYDYFDEELENFDYIVWPALLTESAQLLAKGVAVATSKVQ